MEITLTIIGKSMLILTRRAGESLHIGDTIKVTVISIQGRQVRLGIDVPDEMLVYREEVYLRIKNENQEAAQSSDNDIFAVAGMLRGKS